MRRRVPGFEGSRQLLLPLSSLATAALLYVKDLNASVRYRIESRAPGLVRSRHFPPMLLISSGVLLLAFVISQYTEMYMGQRRLAERWHHQQASVAQAVPNGVIRLVIPKIDLTSFIVEGTDHEDLLLGPGHLEHTAEPGESGNAVISGHRDTFFRHIHELEKGDTIYVDRGGRRVVYQVIAKKIVPPTDLAVTRPTHDNELTLITCYPTYYIGPAPKRLVVIAKMLGDQPNGGDPAANKPLAISAATANAIQKP